MRRVRVLLLVVVGLASAVVIVRRLLMPTSTVVEQPPPPVVETREPLQADAEGYYVPGYRFTVGRFRFAGFRLRPEALVTFAQTTGGTAQPAACLEARITPESVHLRCNYPPLGTVTIDGRFLTRSLTSRLDVPVLSAVVTVRAAGGEILYSARDSFEWHPGE